MIIAKVEYGSMAKVLMAMSGGVDSSVADFVFEIDGRCQSS
jgi:tRNA U34 2-thiouridine synthase MnmA/TrmU